MNILQFLLDIQRHQNLDKCLRDGQHVSFTYDSIILTWYMMALNAINLNCLDKTHLVNSDI